MTQWGNGTQPPYQGQPSYEAYDVTPYSAQPYAEPFSAPPHQQQPPYVPYQPMPQPPPPPAPRRNTRVLALIASLVVLAVVAVGIVVVIAVRRSAGDKNVAQPGTAAASAPAAAATTEAAQVGPIDMCLVGNWRLTSYSATFDLTEAVADGKPVGKVKATGSGVEVVITADGDSTSDYTGVTYTGKTADGRAVALVFSGGINQSLRTVNHQLLYTAKTNTLVMSIRVDNKEIEKGSPATKANPQPYTCAPNSWTTTSLTEAEAAATYTRV
jgi:hypothetical protein